MNNTNDTKNTSNTDINIDEKKAKRKYLFSLIRISLIVLAVILVLFFGLKILLILPIFPSVKQNYVLFKTNEASDWFGMITTAISITLSCVVTYYVNMLNKSNSDKKALEDEMQKKLDLQIKKENKIIAGTEWASALQFKELYVNEIIDSNIYNYNILQKFKSNTNVVFSLKLISNKIFPIHFSFNIEKLICNLWFNYSDGMKCNSMEFNPILTNGNNDSPTTNDSLYSLYSTNDKSVIEFYIRRSDNNEINECLSILSNFKTMPSIFNSVEMKITGNISDKTKLYLKEPFEFTLHIVGEPNKETGLIDIKNTTYEQPSLMNA